MAWNARLAEWAPLASNDASLEGLEWLSFVAQDPQTAQRYLLQRDRKMHFLLAPSQGSGNGPENATLAVDYIEARIGYQWPEPE